MKTDSFPYANPSIRKWSPAARSRPLVLAGMALAFTLTACAGEPPPAAFPGMSVSGQYAYLANNFHLTKWDLNTGAEVWKFPATQDNNPPIGPFSGTPLKFGDWIIIGGSAGLNGGYDPHVYAVSDATGAEVWRFTGTREFVDGVVTDGKLIYAPSGDGALYALDPSNREANGEPRIVWKFQTGNRLWSRPLLADGRLYQASFDHSLYAIDAASGRQIWRFDEPAAPIAMQPAMRDGVLYFASFDGFAYAINASDGSLKWKSAVDAWVWTDPTIGRDLLYMGDVRGKVYAFDLQTGARVWYFEALDSIKAQPVLANDLLYIVSMDTFVYALDPSGVARDGSGRIDRNSIKWRNETLGRRLMTTPVIYGGDLLVPPLDGEVRIWTLNAKTGERGSRMPAAQATATTP
ncbi:MAG: PQQ-binding-like beta-propeller repeat protein [Anaerolineae bacterium]|nr:PQQ-like beta-propeller repeat protein [Thermoflexales bacterium]MDW8408524.1 PQQ-binding-like beta-propeller repeat protein [Anaerolineae bacterium]